MSERRLFEHEIEERLDALLFASSSHRKPGTLAEDLEALPRLQQDLVLQWAAVAAQTYAEIGHMVATLAPQALAQMDTAGFEAWVITALDAYDREG
ncbi:MAG: hypothetical protein Q8N33_09795, partial [Rhodocyclaceae bacterium]|nr:hypothetical protein [Rhodocyclaceae bacterium]